MLSLPKKSSEKGAAASAPAWHPNFRNFAQLPDTKVVRTSFFINGIAVVVASILLLLVGYQEYRLANVRKEIKNAEQQIERDKVGSKAAIDLYGKFLAEEKKIKELAAFAGEERIKLSELILRLGSTLPRDVALDRVEARENDLIIRAYVKGTSDQAGAAVSNYVEQLQRDPELVSRFTISTTNVARDSIGQRMVLDLLFKPKAPAKKP